MSDLAAKQFYITGYTLCPYLEGQYERKVFTELAGDDADHLNSLLTQNGFRRSQSIIYRPFCEECRNCISLRVVVDDFALSHSFRRVKKRNSDLIGTQIPLQTNSEMYHLFKDYLDSRHKNSNMDSMSVADFKQMVEDSPVSSHIIEYRFRGVDSGISGKGEGDLIAAVIVDRIENGLSLVYSFFRPDMPERSLGTFIILDQITRTRQLGLPYLYLGYWVKGSPKMGYKARFHPAELFTPEGWRRNQSIL